MFEEELFPENQWGWYKNQWGRGRETGKPLQGEELIESHELVTPVDDL